MPIGLLTTAGTIGGGLIAKSGAEKAAKIQAKAGKDATDTYLRQYEMTRDDLRPYTNVGRGAVTTLAQLYGLPTGDGGGTGEPYSESALAAFRRAPDYQFALKEGLRARNQASIHGGRFDSGKRDIALTEYASGLASQNFGNYVSRLQALAGVGQSAASQTGAFGANAAGGIANSRLATGEADASGAVFGSNAIGGALGELVNNEALRRMMSTSSSYAKPGGSSLESYRYFDKSPNNLSGLY